tara:strand:- start:456 stop:989 length:534 start_codon:yes stop_codon:yes gene_type:complete
MTKQPSWQKRQVDSFGDFKIEYGNPSSHLGGPAVFSMVGNGAGGTAKLGLRESGTFDIMVDQTVKITGAANNQRPDGYNGVEIVSMEGGVAITCQKGTLKLIAANIEVVSGSNIHFKASGKITNDADHVHFHVRDLDVDPGKRFMGNSKRGDIVVREAGFLHKCYKNTDVKDHKRAN